MNGQARYAPAYLRPYGGRGVLHFGTFATPDEAKAAARAWLIERNFPIDQETRP